MNKALFIVICSAIMGYLSYGHSEQYWPLSVATLLLPTLWLHAQSRLVSGLVLSLYSLLVSRGLIVGASVFFEVSLFEGALWWLLAGLMWFLGGFVCWHQKRRTRLWLIPILMLVLILPPVGLVGWTHPLVSAGFLFPSLGFLGLFLAFSVVVFAAIYVTSVLRGIGVVGVLIGVAFFQSVIAEEQKPTHLHTHNTHFTYFEHDRTFMQSYKKMISVQSLLAKSENGLHWLPEFVGGKWTDTTASYWMKWSKRHPKKTVLLSVADKVTELNKVVLIEPNVERFQVFYEQRFPVPMVSSLSDLKMVLNYKLSELNGETYGVLICYESLMVWPVLQSMWYQPDYLLVNGSVYWSPDSILNVQRSSVRAWGLLFDTPVIEAWNL